LAGFVLDYSLLFTLCGGSLCRYPITQIIFKLSRYRILRWFLPL